VKTENTSNSDREVLVQTVFRVGKRLRCRLAIPQPRPGEVFAMVCEWQPTLPNRPLTGREWKDYRRGRGSLLAEAARLLGGNVMCLEAPANGCAGGSTPAAMALGAPKRGER
jgi:hypothetical protein